MVVRLIGLLAACAVALPFLGSSAQKTDDLLVDGSGDSELYPEQGELESGGMSEEQINSRELSVTVILCVYTSCRICHYNHYVLCMQSSRTLPATSKVI